MTGAGDISIREGDRLEACEYRALRADAEWSDVGVADDQLQAALDATWNVTARTAEGELVGMARLLDDGAVYASLWDMIVRRDRRGDGTGQAIFEAVMRRAGKRTLVSLVATPLGEPLYRRAGFVEQSRGSTGMVWRRPPSGVRHLPDEA
jgi:GNAT superfamily N-acetyltransferase